MNGHAYKTKKSMVWTDNGTERCEDDWHEQQEKIMALMHEAIDNLHWEEMRAGWNKPVNTKVSKARVHPTVKRTIRNTLPYKLRID